jgi:hypothetical protein
MTALPGLNKYHREYQLTELTGGQPFSRDALEKCGRIKRFF